MIHTQFMYEGMKECSRYMVEEEKYYSEKLKATEYNKAIILPAMISGQNWAMGGVVDNKGSFISGSGQKLYGECGYDISEQEIVDSDEEVIYLGYFVSCYGHVITDNIRHVWYLKTPEFKELHQNKRIVYIHDGSLKEYEKELFLLAGVNLEQCSCVDKPTRFKSIIIPDSSFRTANQKGCRAYSLEYKQTVDEIIHNALEKIPPHNLKKVYFTRTKWFRMRDDWGEKTIEKLLSKQGFRIIHPESLSVSEQIAYLQGCDEFVSTEGSIGHNALFVRPDCKVAILRKALYINGYTYCIDSLKGTDTTIVDCSLSTINKKGLEAYSGPFFIYPNDNFCNYFQIRRHLFPWHDYREYIQNIWRYKDAEERLSSLDIYTAILTKEIYDTKNRIDVWVDRLTHLHTYTDTMHSSTLIDRIGRKMKRLIFNWVTR